jgi:hypothetical protein
VRIRSLKPGFFKNEDLAELSSWHRLCYQGLWLCADRDGRVQDRPKRLKAEIFPYDDLNIDLLLWDLARTGFIRRYVVGHQPLIDIPSFADHQHPRQDEAASSLASYEPGSDRMTSTLDTTTYPSSRAIETDPSLSSDCGVTDKRMGTGVLGLGSGVWEHGTSAAAAASSPEATPKLREDFRAQDLLELWNATTKPPIPRCRELTDDRRRKIRTRIAARPSLAEWRKAFEAIQSTPFYRGENDRGWTADFDWVLKNDTTITKVLERARTPKREAVSYEWTCPHEPPCNARHACSVRTALEKGRVAAG